MTSFDVVVILVITASLISGALRGFVRTLLTAAALIVGLVLAAQGYRVVGSVLLRLGIASSEPIANALGLLLIVIVALVGGFLAGSLLKAGLRRFSLDWVDRALGAFVGLVRGWLVCSIVFLALTAFPIGLPTVNDALTAPLLAQGAKVLGVFTSSDLRSRFYEAYSNLTDSK